MIIEAKRAIIAITIRSSMRVNPLKAFLEKMFLMKDINAIFLEDWDGLNRLSMYHFLINRLYENITIKKQTKKYVRGSTLFISPRTRY